MLNETQPVNGLVALMAILDGQDGGWTLIERGGELYVVPPTIGKTARRAYGAPDRARLRA
jgi:hypothetical protein